MTDGVHVRLTPTRGITLVTQLYAADAVFVTGTTGEPTPVLTVDGRRIGSGEPGPVSRRPPATRR